MIHKKIDKIWVVILAAGKGTRMKSKAKNKVAYEVKGVPMITRTLKTIRDCGIKNIIVVVGYAKESVISLLDKKIIVAEQKKRLGTGHAFKVGLNKVPGSAEAVLALYGDDSFLYTGGLLNKLIKSHLDTSSALTFLSIEIEDPKGLGRIVRDSLGNVTGIVEEKDATEEQRKIREINSACYIFDMKFLKKYVNRMVKSPVTGEYYLPGLVEIAVKEKEKIQAYKIKDLKWRGVNTQDELKEAEQYIE
jgi:bifunctional UDP-N-acetylglucosamine pyrophosphorylase / glucosamine-1-phosphate N-acetyltransferase